MFQPKQTTGDASVDKMRDEIYRILNSLGSRIGSSSSSLTITGAATTIVSDDLTASRVVISNASGKIAVSAVTSTTLSYLDATSSVQTQLNGKEPTLTKGDLTATGAIALDQTRQVIGGAAAISHVDTAGYKHVPTGGTTGYFLKYGGSSGTAVWAAHGLTASDVGAISGSGTDNYVAKFNGTGAVQSSIIYDNDTNVGIGTTTPAANLQIAKIPSNTFGILAGNDVSGGGMTDDTRKYLRIGCPSYDIDEEPVSVLTVDNNGTDNILYIGGGTSAGNAATSVQIRTAALNTTIGTTRVTVDSAGNVGIDSLTASRIVATDASKNLVSTSVDPANIISGPGTDNYIPMYNGTNALENSVMYQKDVGGVGTFIGFGTVNPVEVIDVAGNIRASGLNASTVLVSSATKTITSSSVASSDLVGGAGTDNYVVRYNGTNGLQNSIIFDDDTKVGIGTNAPISKLEVKDPTDPGVLTISGGNSISAVGQEYAALQFRSGDLSPLSTNDIVGKIAAVAEYANGAYAGMAFCTADNVTSPYLNERVRITNSGNVGVGTSSPLGNLDVSYGGITIVGGADSNSTSRSSNTTANFRMGSCHYNKSEEPSSVFLASNSVDDNSLRIGGGSTMMNAATNIVFYTANNTTTLAGTERMRIKPEGTIYMYNLGTGGATDLNIGSDGEVIRVTSSGRYKDNIRDPDIDSSKILKFKPKQFNWIDNECVATCARGVADYGFIAEQIAEVMPDMVNYNKDGTVQSWKTQKMLVLAIAEIQRQNGRINALEEHIHKLQEDKNGH